MKGISLIICIYNGRDRIEPTLRAAVNQRVSMGFTWELLIVDNNSNDGSVALCQQILEQDGKSISSRVIEEPNPGLSNARRAGILQSQFEYVVFCDDDNWLSEDYLERAFQNLESNPDVGILGGFGVPEFGDAVPSWFSKYERSYAVGKQALATGYIKIPDIVYGAGMVLRKRLLQAIYQQGFNSLLSDRTGKDLVSGGDNEICVWYRVAGFELYYDESMRFKHFIPTDRLTERYLVRRTFAKGKTESILRVYQGIMDKSDLNWAANKLVWYFEVVKRFLLLLLTLRPSGLGLKLKRTFLASCVQFRAKNYRYVSQRVSMARSIEKFIREGSWRRS